ncbi:hypothetical protein CTI12_AA361110 [Artemisia annua]|uniref:DUF4216 domain-containing protein n=1 Tax=Artemisia annua TaxID=35608 RepID=A0A2U1M9N2_ARTAN|nr:hypothetical protein CTI12_AA361110 [Artemisia annua]
METVVKLLRVTSFCGPQPPVTSASEPQANNSVEPEPIAEPETQAPCYTAASHSRATAEATAEPTADAHPAVATTRGTPQPRIGNLYIANDPRCTPDLFALACGPLSTPTSIKSCVVNGVKFVVHSRDVKRTTQNSGICSPGEKKGEMYYGQLDDILEFSYTQFKVVLFRVKWFDLAKKVLMGPFLYFRPEPPNSFAGPGDIGRMRIAEGSGEVGPP